MCEGLHDADAQALLASVLHVALDARVRDRIVAETRGNPLALVEWPRGLAPAELASGFGMPSVLPMPGQIEERFQLRIEELPPPTQRFLTVAAAEPTGDPVILWRRRRTSSSLGPDDASIAIDAGLVEIGFRVSVPPSTRAIRGVYGSAIDTGSAGGAPCARTGDGSRRRSRSAHVAPRLGSPGPDDDHRRRTRAVGRPCPCRGAASQLRVRCWNVRWR